MADLAFYGKLCTSGILVKVDNGSVTNGEGKQIGTTTWTNEELHCDGGAPLPRRVINLVGGATDGIYPNSAKRTKAAEMWHRWAAMGRPEGYIEAQRVMRAPRAIVHIAPLEEGRISPTLKVAIESIYRPSTGETIYFTPNGIETSMEEKRV